jgi:hypothetical protein
MWKVLKEIQHCLWTTKPPRLATPFLEGGMVVLEPSSDGMIPGRLVYEVAKSTFSLSAEDWSHGPKEQQLAGSEAFGRHAKYGPPYSSRSF